MLTTHFCGLSVVLLCPAELDLLFLQLELLVVLSCLQSEPFFSISCLGISHVNLFDKRLSLDLVLVQVVHLLLQLLCEPLVGGIAVPGIMSGRVFLHLDLLQL